MVKEVMDKKDKKMVYMSLKDFVDEHKELIKCLREGSREELLAMADEQEEELEEEAGEEDNETEE